MKKKIWAIVGAVVVIIAAVCGGFYYHMSTSVSKDVPGHVYQYQSVSGDKALYVTFAKSGEKVIVNQNRDIAMDAVKSESAFDSAYQKQSKDANWSYKAQGGTLTLAQQKANNQVSQWQYNGILSSSKKFTARSFTYQIAKAGQGKVNKKTVFNKVD